jgi:hypothetical protein
MIVRGIDQPGVQIAITNDDGSAVDLLVYTTIEVHLVDGFGAMQAKYMEPSQDGYHPLRLVSTNTKLEFDIFSADSANFKKGRLFCDILLTQPDTNYPNATATIEIKGLYLEEVV